MPNNVNAEKAMRQSEKARLRNRAGRTMLRTVIRKVIEAVAAGDATVTQQAFRFACRRIDQAAAKHLIHANKAARLKSRLTAKLTPKPAAPAK